MILDHEPTSVTVTKQATCTEKGEETCYCELCDVSYTRSIPALGHEYGEDGVCIREGCGHTLSSVGSSFVVDDVWEKSNPSQPKFDTFTLTCTVRTTPDENGQGENMAFGPAAHAGGVCGIRGGGQRLYRSQQHCRRRCDRYCHHAQLFVRHPHRLDLLPHQRSPCGVGRGGDRLQTGGQRPWWPSCSPR